MKLSDLQRCRVVDEAGERIGHLFDVACELRAHDEPPAVTTLLVGRAGLARRLGIGRGRAEEVPAGDVVEVRDREVVVRRRH